MSIHARMAGLEKVSLSNIARRAFLVGVEDGLQWDLDGFADIQAVKLAELTWTARTIQNVSDVAFLRRVGNPMGHQQISIACDAYNAGVHAGVLAKQRFRSGLPPRG